MFILLGILVICSFGLLYIAQDSLLKRFEESCYDSIKKKDKELEEDEKFKRELKKLLFK